MTAFPWPARWGERSRRRPGALGARRRRTPSENRCRYNSASLEARSPAPQASTVAETEEPSRPPPGAAAAEEPAATDHPHRQGLYLFAAALAVCLLAYLVAAVPGGWFPGASTKTWGASQLSLSRGVGVIENGELGVTGVDASGTAVISPPWRCRETTRCVRGRGGSGARVVQVRREY